VSTRRPSLGGRKAGKLSAIRTLGGHRRYRESEVRALLQGRFPRSVRATEKRTAVGTKTIVTRGERWGGRSPLVHFPISSTGQEISTAIVPCTPRRSRLPSSTSRPVQPYCGPAPRRSQPVGVIADPRLALTFARTGSARAGRPVRWFVGPGTGLASGLSRDAGRSSRTATQTGTSRRADAAANERRERRGPGADRRSRRPAADRRGAGPQVRLDRRLVLLGSRLRRGVHGTIAVLIS